MKKNYNKLSIMDKKLKELIELKTQAEETNSDELWNKFYRDVDEFSTNMINENPVQIELTSTRTVDLEPYMIDSVYLFEQLCEGKSLEDVYKETIAEDFSEWEETYDAITEITAYNKNGNIIFYD
nr:MAG TPA: hypothetical protein [Bacteriophage sp.]